MPFVKNPGTVIELGGERFVMPPLALGTIEQMGNILGGLAPGAIPRPEDVGPLIDLLHESLKRNYPDMPRAQVAMNVDIGNLEANFKALMKTSELVREAREDDGLGESAAVTG